jgi:predicted metal-dependent hydrolase
MTYVKSNLDDKFYLVRNSDDQQEAVNTLAKIYQNIIELSDKLEKEKDKYKDFKEYIELLHSKAKDIVLVESTQDSKYTSYSVNKGEQIVFCLRTKRSGNKLHDLNLIMYVVLHEISHVACPIYDGHGPLFKKIFAFLTARAIEMGLYTRIDFVAKPEEYCGMTINESII